MIACETMNGCVPYLATHYAQSMWRTKTIAYSHICFAEYYLVHGLSWCQGLSKIREGIFGNNKLILQGVLNSISP